MNFVKKIMLFCMEMSSFMLTRKLISYFHVTKK